FARAENSPTTARNEAQRGTALADPCAFVRADYHARGSGRVFGVHHGADFRLAEIAERISRSKSARLAGIAPPAKRPKLRGAGDARYGRFKRAISDERVVSAIRAVARRYRRGAHARRAKCVGTKNRRAARLFAPPIDAILGCDGSHVRLGEQWQRNGSEGTDS